MIQSMTGFGKGIAELSNKKIIVEVKSLNSKQLDLSTRVPSLYREKEMEIRSEVARRLERGKVELTIRTENISTETSARINVNAMRNYHAQIVEAAAATGIDVPQDWFSVLMRMPEILVTESAELPEDEAVALMQAVSQALDQLVEFRLHEGKGLQEMFTRKLENIAALLKEVEPYEQERVEKIRTRIVESLSKIKEIDYDKNRLEQEMIYYIEKLDVNEEKHRLADHLRYFAETMENGSGQGKKLGFIAQEMGREINTLGSKSNHAEMQRIVVRMKDELEQIKEQVLNIM
ncbi:MAG: YicC family protein [Bacteroidaceae bacterium]|nr:YicC family protein [Bacteroidaceae bacterium]